MDACVLGCKHLWLICMRVLDITLMMVITGLRGLFGLITLIRVLSWVLREKREVGF
jgi:hypothetical protein